MIPTTRPMFVPALTPRLTPAPRTRTQVTVVITIDHAPDVDPVRAVRRAVDAGRIKCAVDTGLVSEDFTVRTAAIGTAVYGLPVKEAA